MRATPRIRRKTITAADLLREIKTLVLEEPRRLDMRTWIAAYEGRIRRGTLLGASLTPEDLPQCGTVGCVAGWGATLLRRPNESPSMTTAVTTMRRLLGKPKRLYGYTHFYDVDGLFCPGGRLGAPGTKVYARNVAKRIDNYLTKHPDLETRVIDVATRKVIKRKAVGR